METKSHRIGIVGTGFIGRGLTRVLAKHAQLRVAKVLTRRNLNTCLGFPDPNLLTNSRNELLDQADLVVECSGDVFQAAEVINSAMEANLPVVTLNSEFHVTVGSYFVNRGVITEAEGDQPGGLAMLHENSIAMGFRPFVYANVKGFYDPNPTAENMRYWSEKQGISLAVVTAATDGTKIQFEQALVANAFDLDIAKKGFLGSRVKDIESGAATLVDAARKMGKSISDYIIVPSSNIRVFLIATHQPNEAPQLEYLKMGKGPNYLIPQPFNLTYFEIPKTILRILSGGLPLLNNSTCPRISVSAVAKRKLSRGDYIKTGIGGFDVRGLAVRAVDMINHVPIGLIQNCFVKENVQPGQILTYGDVDLPDSLAKTAWEWIRNSYILPQSSPTHS